MLSGISKVAGIMVAETLGRPLHTDKKLEINKHPIVILGSDTLKDVGSGRLIIASNHIGPTDFIGRMSTPDSGLTPDALILSFVIEQITNRKPFIIAGYNDEWVRNKNLFKKLKPYYAELSIATFSRLGYLPVDKTSIDRDNSGRQKSVEQCLGAGNIVVNFLEGRWRNRDHSYRINPPKVAYGTAYFSINTDSPVLPCYIDTSPTFAELGHTIIKFGTPIYPDGLNSKNIKEEIAKQVIELQEESLSPNSSIYYT